METLIINMLIGYAIYKVIHFTILVLTGRDLEQ